MRINFKIDLVSQVKRQLGWDNDRKNREAAKQRADPIVANRISEYHTRYPHLTPGVTLSAAKMGYDPDGPEIAKLAELAYKRRLSKGQGDYSIGDVPSLKDNPRRAFEERVAEAIKVGPKPRESGGVLDVFKPAARSVAVFGESVKEVVAAAARGTMQSIEDRDLNMLLNPLAAGKQIISSGEITGVEAIKSMAAGKGSGLGHGYLPNGPTTEKQAEAARESYSIEYADNSLFGGEKQKVERHAGTLGRILFKDVFEPGSFWFQVGSGAVDFTAALVTDPAAKLSKVFSEGKAAKAAFTAEEAGRVTPSGKVIQATSREATEEASTLPVPFTSADEDPELVGKTRAQISEILTSRRKSQIASDIGLVQGRRSTVHGPTMTNWLTTHSDGKAFVKAVLAESDAYTIWKKMGGEGSQLSPLIARKMADITDETEMVAALSPDLGTGLKLKPEVGHLNHVGGAFEGIGIKDNIRSVRMLNTMPRGTIDVDDAPDAVTQIVRYLRNAKVPEESISPHFDAYTRALTTEDRVDVMRNVQWAAARHIAEQELTGLGTNSITALNRNFSTLRSIYARDMDIVDRLNKLHAARGTSVDNIVIDGELSAPLRTHWEDIEANRLFTFANPRDVKKITSTYGRLISHPTLEMPLIALDHINSVMKGVNILRPALTVRVIGEQLGRMTVEGYETVLNNPRSAIAWVTGAKGNLDVFGENFDSAGEFSKFKKSLVHHGDLHSKISMEAREVVPFTDKRFLSGWADDIQYLTEHPVAARLSGRWDEGTTTGNFLEDTKKWLASDHPDAIAYRAETPELTTDNLSQFVDQINATLTAKTYNNPTLMDAVRTGLHNGEPILTTTPGGKPKFSRAFKAHLKTLVDADKSPELTIGDFRQIKNLDDLSGTTRKVTDHLFGYLLTRPGNYLNNSPTFRQAYWKSATDELITHASPDVQKVLIQGARDANLGEKVVEVLKKKAATSSGDLTLKEVDFHANARAAEAVSDLFYNLQDRGQFMDSMRLIWPFGEAWKEALTVWAHLTARHPQIIPRALMAANGARESGFIYTDPATGVEMFAYPGGQFITKKLFGMPTPIQAPIGSLNMVTGGKNPYMPGFGILVQTPVSAFLPDVPKFDFIRDLVVPYEAKTLDNPWNLLPSWAQPIRDVIGSPAHEVQFMNNVKDVMAYLHSTGQYPMESQADMEKLTERATQIAKGMTAFSVLAKSTLPASPSYRDVAEDKEGHTTFAFALTDRYRQLLEEDREANTNLAVSKFLDEFGEKNLLYMQSASKGGNVFTKSGYDWVRDNKDIARTYPEIYGLLAPQDGGFDIKAYHAMFENGERKPLTPNEMLVAAQNRVAKAEWRNAQDKLPPSHRRTDAQKEWLANIKTDLLERYPHFTPEFQGNETQTTIRLLTEAVEDKKVAKLPIGKAIAEYLTYRKKVVDGATRNGITGWQTAKSAKAARDWLRDKAELVISKYPAFKEVNRELFDQELAEDD